MPPPHPETAKGVAGGKAGGNGRPKVATLPDSVATESSFVADTAAKTGQAESTVRQHVQVGNALEKSGVGEKILGTPVAKRQKELGKRYLVALASSSLKSHEHLTLSGRLIVGIIFKFECIFAQFMGTLARSSRKEEVPTPMFGSLFWGSASHFWQKCVPHV